MINETPNINYIKELSGGEKEFELKIITIIKKEFPLEKKTYLKNLNSKNFKHAAENVHKLKHKISILGLTKSYDIAVLFEENLLAGNNELKEDFETILNIMADYLKSL